jgi:hypothetical protein
LVRGRRREREEGRRKGGGRKEEGAGGSGSSRVVDHRSFLLGLVRGRRRALGGERGEQREKGITCLLCC